MKENIFYTAIIVLLAFGVFFPKSQNTFLGGAAFTSSNNSTSTSKVIGTTSTLIATVYGHEQWACNTGPAVGWLGFGIDAATTTDGGQGIMAVASTTANCAGPFHFKGRINGAVRSGTTEIGIVDFR